MKKVKIANDKATGPWTFAPAWYHFAMQFRQNPARFIKSMFLQLWSNCVSGKLLMVDKVLGFSLFCTQNGGSEYPKMENVLREKWF